MCADSSCLSERDLSQKLHLEGILACFFLNGSFIVVKSASYSI